MFQGRIASTWTFARLMLLMIATDTSCVCILREARRDPFAQWPTFDESARNTWKGRYDLQIIDLSLHPTLAEGEQIIAVPTLIRKLPTPLRRFIGDMSQTENILTGLDLLPAATGQTPSTGG